MNFLYKDHHLNQFCLLIIEHFEAKLSCPLLPENKGWLRIRLGESVRAGVALPGIACLLYTSPSPRDATLSRMPSSA